MNQLERVGLEGKDQGEDEGEDEGEAKGTTDIQSSQSRVFIPIQKGQRPKTERIRCGAHNPRLDL